MMDNSYEEIMVVIDSNNAEASLKELIESFQGLNSLVSNIGAAITKAFASMQNSLIKTESSIGALTKVLTDMTAKLQELSQTSFLDVFATIIDTTTLIADLAINAELLGKVFSKLGGVLANFSGWIAGAFSTIGSWITGTLIPLISGAITACGGWIVAIVAAVIAAIVAVVVYWDEIKLFFTETLPQLWNQFVEWISGIGTIITDWWESIMDTLATVAQWVDENVLQPIGNFFSNAMQWIGTKVQEGIAFVQSIFGGITAFLQGVFANGRRTIRYVVRATEGRPYPSRLTPYPFRLRCPAVSLARTPASLADRGTRLCSASSATGSAEQRGPKGEGFLWSPGEDNSMELKGALVSASSQYSLPARIHTCK